MLLPLAALLLAGLPQAALAGSHLKQLDGDFEIRNISFVVSPKASASDMDLCRDVAPLSEQDIRFFLREADRIDGNQKHYDYNWAVCHTRAELGRKGSKQRFATVEIQPTGLGTLELGDGSEIGLGCRRKCEKLFGDLE